MEIMNIINRHNALFIEENENLPEYLKDIDNYTIKNQYDSFEMGDIVYYTGYSDTNFYISSNYLDEEYIRLSLFNNDINGYRFHKDYVNHVTKEKLINFKKISKICYYLAKGGLIKNISDGKIYYSLYGIDDHSEYCNNDKATCINILNPNDIKRISYSLFISEEYVKVVPEDLTAVIDYYNKKLELAKENFKHLEDSLNLIYPDNHEIIAEDDKTIVTLYFDKITIRNERASNEITNLFVKLTFDKLCRLAKTIEGTRTSQSVEEYDSNYIHSHLPRARIGSGYREFCLGTTDMYTTIEELKVEYEALSMELLLIRIKDYVVWESLSGGPYIRMSDIRLASNGMYHSRMFSNTKLILNEISELDIEFKSFKHNNSFKIKESNKLEVELVNILSDHYNDEDLKPYIIKKDLTNNRYFTSNNESTNQLANRIKSINDALLGMGITFKGTLYPYKITTEIKKIDENIGDNVVNVLNRQSYNYIIDDINKKLFEFMHYKEEVINYEKEEESKESETINKTANV